MKVRLGDLLVEQGLITAAQLKSALQHQKRHPGYRKLGETILALKLVTEDEMLRTLARALRIKAIDLRKVSQVEPAALQTLDVGTAEREQVLPLRFVQQGSSRRLQVAMADPTNLSAVDELQFRLGVTVEPCLTTITQVRDAIRRFYRGATLDMDGLIDIDPEDETPVRDGPERTWVGPDPELLDQNIRIVELKFFSGPSKGASVQIADGGDMVFGRGQDVDYTVNDNRMSRRHFQVKARRERVELEDMRSSNGTFLNKQPVSRAELSDGDWVQAGNSLIKIEFVEPI